MNSSKRNQQDIQHATSRLTSRGTMRHVIRMNVRGRGYTLYSGGSSTSYNEHPLDVQSPGIPNSYISAQKRIDGLLRGSLHRPYISISNLGTSSLPLVVYGCNFPIKDEHGRLGLSFIHAIQDNTFPSANIVMSIARFLNPGTMDEISEYLASVAQGSVKPETFIRLVTDSFSSTQRIPKQPLEEYATPIRSITHDCVGTVLAWAAMSASHSTTAPPWEIYDKYSNQDREGLLSTVSTAPSARKDYRLSEFILDVVCRDILVQPNSADKKVASSTPNKAATPPEAATPPKTAAQHEAIPERPAPPSLPSAHDAALLPKSGCIVVIDRRYDERKDDQLWLADESELYLVTLKNCVDVKEFPLFYKLKIHRPRWKIWIRQKYIQLVIFKAEINPEGATKIGRFLQFLKQNYVAPEVGETTSPENDTKEAEPTKIPDDHRETPGKQQGQKVDLRSTLPPIRDDLALSAIIILMTVLVIATMVVMVILVL